MLISPARTSQAPIHNTPTMPEKTRKMTIAVISARVQIRRRAASKLFSVTLAKWPWLIVSWVKACTACTDNSASEALPEDAAIQSWFSRLSLRRRRPSTRSWLPSSKGQFLR